jgi:PIN domain nuclease of toxin-antitoxin system
VLIWLSAEPQRLSSLAHDAIAESRGNDGLCISAITLWEVALLASRNRIQISGPIHNIVHDLAAPVLVKQITASVCITAVGFGEEIPRDPADRIIAATSVVEGIPLVTADQKLRASGVLETIW